MRISSTRPKPLKARKVLETLQWPFPRGSFGGYLGDDIAAELRRVEIDLAGDMRAIDVDIAQALADLARTDLTIVGQGSEPGV